MNEIGIIAAVVGSGLIGALASYFFYTQDMSRFDNSDAEASDILDAAKKEKQDIINAAKESAKKIKQSSDEEAQAINEQFSHIRKAHELKENTINRKEERNNKLSEMIAKYTQETEHYKTDGAGISEKMKNKLEEIVGKKSDELLKEIMNNELMNIENDKEKKMRILLDERKEDMQKESKIILAAAIQQYAGPTSIERQSTNVALPREIMKGMLIGKDGTNIAYLESLFPGVQFIFNHEKNILTISGFNYLNRHVARATVEQLIRKKQVSHRDIQEAAKKGKEIIDRDIMKEGRKALKMVGIKERDDKLTWLVGRMKYRMSYGQNILIHSIEMAFFAATIAGELNCDVEKAKTATFFHDIGKAIDHDIDTDEGHDYLTKEILEKYGYDEDIVHAAFVHHDAEPQRIPEAFIVKAADAISAGRPGVRQESLRSYLERIEALENIATAIAGVKKAYSVSAGREIRLFVNPKEINDGGLEGIAENCAHEIEENLTYPGKIKVQVIRNLKATEVAHNKK